MESVRVASPDDLDAVTSLAKAFVAEQRQQRGGPMWLASDGAMLRADALRASVDDPTRLVLLGKIDDVPVGLLLAHLEALDDGSLLAVVRGLYVEIEARAVGVGTALLDAGVSTINDTRISPR